MTPHTASADYLRLHDVRVGSSFDMFLRPHNKDYWSASNSAPHVAKINEGLLAHGFFDVSAVGAGTASLELNGKGGERLEVLMLVHGR